MLQKGYDGMSCPFLEEYNISINSYQWYVHVFYESRMSASRNQ
ncbi:hypothetical protein SAMN05444375_106109 [Segatella baroniae B14]|jgi:hypothetical protein|nr:hypothetical protein SAMN04487899_105118 [Segatella bryantii]SEA07127.1 hypothetical protein SAMN05216455_10366 [Segatella bryantii]SEQ19570.1 hypothetical protein SAMN05444375_106109 [Segatella baroniae B14]